ncbi:DUF4910 domain-containing protein [Candidatus Chloroploca asiatica]|uniref:DUF4910 domain-containing protein n=1 Tax=Candidatus Chloroploca asiatica TaxID=1506545 RepID=A0A2H3L447_9CHLR|nr:DUF4910 domain-containing protein [Candidatus Chloroploca asiatica]PDV97010.1 hypothetical protein A9Q02_05625 [Candidatus Chloroploca asiatica]
MFQQLLTTVGHEVSGEAARALVARISQWHRIQASPMYREAAHWVHATLQSYGLDATLESFPVGEGRQVWGEPLFDEWQCHEGWLDLLLPDGSTQRLADYRAVPLSLLPRSVSTDGEFELVVVERGDRVEDYADLEVAGKLILTRSMPMSVYRVAIEKLGAAGVICDGMRSLPEICPPGDLPDAIQYASWWWWGGERRAFGFALSPRVGAALRRRAARAADEGRVVRLRARVRSSFTDGAIEAVSAFIPGQSNEEILLVAHLCHPAPCANDNATGAAAAMEVARALHTLIESGRLPRPQRALRFLWMPEMTGTYLYLARHEGRIERTVAALNLDMVGADQARCGSVNTIIHTPDALPSFVGDLLEAIRTGMHGVSDTLYGRTEPPLLRMASAPFSNGSDHYILADPTVGIPTPLIIEWPDRFYHTTADTLDQVSATTLQRNMTLAGTYLAFLANAGSREATWLASELKARFVTRMAQVLQMATTAALSGEPPRGASWDLRLAYRFERHAAALADLRRIDPAFDPLPAQQYAALQMRLLWEGYADVLEPWQLTEVRQLPADQSQLVPRRLYRGPVSLRPHLRRLDPLERETAQAAIRAASDFDSLVADLALFWVDGQRTLGEILNLIELETEVREPEALFAYFDLLVRLDLLAW